MKNLISGWILIALAVACVALYFLIQITPQNGMWILGWWFFAAGFFLAGIILILWEEE